MLKKVSRKFASLVVADPNKLSHDTKSLMSFASKFGEPVVVLQLTDSKLAGEVSKFYDGSFGGKDVKIKHVANDHVSAHDYQFTSHVIGQLMKGGQFNRLIMGNSGISKEVLPYIAAGFGSQAVTDITGFISATQFVRPIYAGNAVENIEQPATPQFLGVRLSSFEKAEGSGSAPAVEATEVDSKDFAPKIKVLSTTVQKSERPELTSARVIVTGGRAFKNAEGFQKLYGLADKIPGSNVGATRASVDAGFCSNDLQIGQTGKVVAPELYIALGVSGAIQHLAGMKESKVIVAVNKDPEAPIFKIANYGLVADVFQVVEELKQKL